MTRITLFPILAVALLFNAQTAFSANEKAAIPTPPQPVTRASRHKGIDQQEMETIGLKHGFCALTFDDGPSQHTETLLQVLRQRNVRATFFMLGANVRHNPDLVRRIAEEGHEIANHSASHSRLSKLSGEAQSREIKQVQTLFEHLGVESHYLRPPYGSFNSQTVKEAEKLGLGVVLWTVDTNDWRHPLAVEKMCTKHGYTKPDRGVFLMHDTQKKTLEGLPTLLDYLDSRQCRYVTISEYLGRVPVADAIPPVVEHHESPMQPAQNPEVQNAASSPAELQPPLPATPQATTPDPTSAPQAADAATAKADAVAPLPEAKQPLDPLPEKQQPKEKPDEKTQPRENTEEKSFFHRLFGW